MRTIRPKNTLVYYDGIEVFDGLDHIGGHYVGVLVGREGVTDQYLVTGVEPRLLRQFKSGILDLRTLLLDSSKSEWYMTYGKDDLSQSLILEERHGPLTETDYLPDSGFLLHDSSDAHDLVHEARERNNVVFELSVDTVEGIGRIRADMLGNLLTHLQKVVKYAYNKSVRNSPSYARYYHSSRPDASLLDVVGYSSGSFKVLLEAANRPDVRGFGELSRGLAQMDEIFASAHDPDNAFRILEDNRGRLATSYIKLLSFLSEHSTGLWYSWAEPNSVEPIQGGVSEEEARFFVERIDKVSESTTEDVVLVGELDKADRNTRVWRLWTEDGKRSGKTIGDSVNLNGLEIGKRYRFNCIERTEISEATGRELQTLILSKILPL